MRKVEENRFYEKKQWIGAAVFFLLSFLLQMAARNVRGFGEWYGTHIYPWLTGILGRISGIFPFSLVEFCLYGLAVWLIYYGYTRRKKPGKVIGKMVFLSSFLVFLYTINCGINYYRTPFSEISGLEIRDSSVEELERLCSYLTDQVCVYGEQMAEGKMEDWKKDIPEESRQAMEHLGTMYPALKGYYPVPKPVTVSAILSVQQLSGIYSPFTIEANYNRAMTPYNIPHTACHELSHLRGFMREDEANFIGYLACIQSENPWFRYSGYLSGWIYAGNALAKEDMEAYRKLYERLPEEVLRDLQENSRFWDRYEGKVAETANKINDVYLKINSQEDGVKSYGRVVDLMLSYYRK